MFYERLKKYCRQHGTSLSRVIRTGKMSDSLMGEWKSGKLPNVQTIFRLANILEVDPIDIFLLLLDDVSLHNTISIDDEIKIDSLNPDEKEFISIYRQLSNINKHYLMTAVYDFVGALKKND